MGSSSRSKRLPSWRERAAVQLVRWQGIMRLQDWDIELRVARAHEMPDGGLGAAQMRDNEKSAVILLCDPDDINSAWESDSDIELTIVHELMHLKTHQAIVTQDKLAVEQMVEGLARVLVRLDRREQR